MRFGRLASRLAAPLAIAMFASAAPVSSQEVMKTLEDLDIDFVGVTVDIEDNEYIGQRGDTEYRWDVMATPADRGTRDHKLAIEHLMQAGIPAARGAEINLERGMFADTRYRMAGTVKRIDIRGGARVEVRVTVAWKVYDAEEAAVAFEGETTGLGKGVTIGEHGEQPNALMESVIKALENVLDEEVPDALGG